VEDDARQLFRIDLGYLCDGVADMPADRFSFAVLIGRDVDGVRFFGQLFDLLDRCGILFGYAVLRRQLFFLFVDLDAKTALWKVSDMAFGGNDFISFNNLSLWDFSFYRCIWRRTKTVFLNIV